MPRKPLKACTWPQGCTARQETTRCPAHTTPRLSPTERGYDGRWRKTRAAHLKRWPTCQRDGCTKPATDVHHIDLKGPKGPRGHDHSNLLSLCHEHHSEVTSTSPGAFGR